MQQAGMPIGLLGALESQDSGEQEFGGESRDEGVGWGGGGVFVPPAARCLHRGRDSGHHQSFPQVQCDARPIQRDLAARVDFVSSCGDSKKMNPELVPPKILTDLPCHWHF